MQMPNDDFSIEELVCNDSFQQYCLGSDLENQILWNEWINNLPERAADIEDARQLVGILSARQGNSILQLKELRDGIKQREALNYVLSASGKSIQLPSVSESIVSGSDTVLVSPAKTYKLYRYAGAVAAAAIIIVASLFFLQHNNLSDRSSSFAKHLSGLSISSGEKPRKTLILNDGTLITLAKESTIRLTENFNSGNRELWLSGEAFFDVKHDPAHPFVIHTSFNDIKVLGTAFNVKAYPNSTAMETALLRGSVRVDSKKYTGYSVTLKPNEKLVTTNNLKDQSHKSNAVFKVSLLTKENTAQKPKEIQWVRNRLDIENEPLSIIAGKLQDWYGIEIYIIDKSVKEYRYSGVFENENIIKTLEALQLSYPFEFKVEQDKIIISK